VAELCIAGHGSKDGRMRNEESSAWRGENEAQKVVSEPQQLCQPKVARAFACPCLMCMHISASLCPNRAGVHDPIFFLRRVA
jgi:hypothetical protein